MAFETAACRSRAQTRGSFAVGACGLAYEVGAFAGQWDVLAMAGSMSVEAASGWRDHLVSAEEAVSVVRPGDKVFVGSGCATPRSLVGALEQLGRPGVVLVHFLTDRVDTGDPSRTKYRHRVFYVGRDVRALAESGWVEYLPLPLSLSDVPELFRNEQIPLDVAMIQVAPPDPDGTCSLGISVDVTKAAALTARTVIAEVNAAMPRTAGDSRIPAGRISRVVAVETPVVE
jgi:acyl-CoA hydrolase